MGTPTENTAGLANAARSEAEVLRSAGLEAFRQGRHKEATDLFRQAADSFQAAEDDLAAAEMANNLSVALVTLKEFAGALRAVEGTPAVFQRRGDPGRQARALGNQAAALEGLGQLAEAAGLYQQAANLFEQIGETEQRATTLRALAAVQLKQNQPFDALASMQAGLSGTARPTLAQRAARRLLKLPARLLAR